MELLHKLERKVLELSKKAPHLPASAQKWLGENVWWIVLIGVILGGIGVIIGLFSLLGLIALLSSPASVYYVYGGVTALTVVAATIGLVFSTLQVVLSAMAIGPLQRKQKKGWVLLFAAWLVYVASVVIGAVLTLNVVSFIVGILFGAIFAAIGAYFLFEIHGQFEHAAKPAKATKKA